MRQSPPCWGVCKEMGSLSRRQLLARAIAAGSGATIAELLGPARFLSVAGAAAPVTASATIPGNPLVVMPDRGWERVYRDQFSDDSTFVFTCAPNDTHNCLLRAHVKNGVVVRISPTYGYGKATDLYGNQASHRWDPRICQKGLILCRRFYGDRRVKAPMIRKGFKDWVDAGFPRNDDGSPKSDLSLRGTDDWIKLSWDDATTIAAKTLENVARTYNGEDGAEKLLEQDYDPAMVEAMHGAGVQTIKMRGGMPLLGVGRIFGFYRFANMLALLDAKVRPQAPPERDRRQPRLRQLRLAYRPPSGPPDGHREPDGRLRPLRSRAHRPPRDHRHELDLHEDAGCPLDRRRPPAGDPRRRDQRGLHADGEQGRRGDHPSRRHRHGALPRRRPRADRTGTSTTRRPSPSAPTCRCSFASTPVRG